MTVHKIGGHRIRLPHNKFLRQLLGWGLVLGGLLGFLPILGFWMLPLGLVVLSVDNAFIRRRRRRMVVWWNRRAGSNQRGGSKGSPTATRPPSSTLP